MAESDKDLERESIRLNNQDETNTADFEKPIELTAFHKWIKKYLMLLATLGGVIFGLIEGQWN